MPRRERHVLDAALLTCAALLTVASLMPLAARWWWFADLFSHFRVQMLAASAVTIAALAAARRGRLALALLPAALLNVAPLVPYLVPAARSAATAAPLRLMSANLLARNESHAEIVATVRTEAPDVVVFLEYTPRWAEALDVLSDDYPYRVSLSRRDWTGIALMSRYPLTNGQAFDLGPVPAVDAHVAAPGGPIRVLGVHLMPPMSDAAWRRRNAQLDALAALGAGREATVVAGDFNLTPYSPFFTGFLERAALGDAFAGRGLEISWPSSAPWLGIKIDHMLISEHLTVAAPRRVRLPGSDHYAIIADLTRE